MDCFKMETVVQLDETVVKGVSPPPLDPTGTTVEPIVEEPTPTYEPVVNHVQPPSPPRQRLPKVSFFLRVFKTLRCSYFIINL